ncbi:hypothetical protein [Streptomyces milbemycinicus]|uniref:hypothetical protein n=1 Tax=Streptomyces milbemycinicus TaxID=476552 RepID=UPI0033F8AA40
MFADEGGVPEHLQDDQASLERYRAEHPRVDLVLLARAALHAVPAHVRRRVGDSAHRVVLTATAAG